MTDFRELVRVLYTQTASFSWKCAFMKKMPFVLLCCRYFYIRLEKANGRYYHESTVRLAGHPPVNVGNATTPSPELPITTDFVVCVLEPKLKVTLTV